jgi:alpha-tubulin suppressor-like RCC1 family protein
VSAWGSYEHDQTQIPDSLAGVTAIDAGYNHTIALKDDGTVVGWGRSTYGQIDIPAGLTGAVAIAAGKEHSVALKADSTVVVWGQNAHSQTDIPAGLTGVKAIAAGGGHTVVANNDGAVVAWGSNDDGQCDVPENLTGVKGIVAGSDYTVALIDRQIPVNHYSVIKQRVQGFTLTVRADRVVFSEPLYDGAELILYDLGGRMPLKKKVRGDSRTLPVSFAGGMGVWRVIRDGYCISGRFIGQMSR